MDLIKIGNMWISEWNVICPEILNFSRDQDIFYAFITDVLVPDLAF